MLIGAKVTSSGGYPHMMEQLQKLDQLLSKHPSTPSYSAELNDEEYTVQQKQWHKRSASQRVSNINFIANAACCLIKEGKPFRMCSVGCGDGRTDKLILEKISEQFPNQPFQYVGVDISAIACQKAQELLQPIANANVQLVPADIHGIMTDSISNCNLVYAVHSLYYVTSVEKALAAMLKLLKPSGQLVIASSPSNPLCELCARFWFHEMKRPYHFTSSVTSALDKMKVAYTVQSPSDIQIDLTECFEEGFDYPSHSLVLDFIAQTKMSQYPVSVRQVCIDYLQSIAVGKPKQFVVNYSLDWLIINN